MANIDAIVGDPRYRNLVSKRRRFAGALSAAILLVYFGFIAVVAFDKPLLGRSLSGGALSVGIPVGLGIILFAVVLTGLYVRRANTQYDAELAILRAEHDA